ncbi:MAG: 16S rRNA (uracil(1498)-N(3))-methyltransferase [Cyclobacteriaceae bacterium]
MNYFYNPEPTINNFLSAEESHHCVKVLRKKVGDQITVIDGKGSVYECIVQSTNSRKCEFEIQNVAHSESNKSYQTHLAISPTKNHDRLEWFVEKACELGIGEISFILTENSERKKINLERLNRKAVSAMKQSKNLFITQLNDLMAFNEFLNSCSEDGQRFIAYVDHENVSTIHKTAKPSIDTIVLVGPEGDFTKNELNSALVNGFEKVSLGESVLRTETAGIVACHSINIVNT